MTGTRQFADYDQPGRRDRHYDAPVKPLHREVMRQLRAAPGGLSETDIREILTAFGKGQNYSVRTVIDGLPDDFPVYDEEDAEGEVWYHALKEGEKREVQMPRKMALNAEGSMSIKIARESHRRAIKLQMAIYLKTGKKPSIADLYAKGLSLLAMEEEVGA